MELAFQAFEEYRLQNSQPILIYIKSMRSIIRRLTILKKIINHTRIKSPHILHFDASGCNGCSIETLACLTPRYDIERFGAVEKGNPHHADTLIVSGALSYKSSRRLKRLYEQMPEPKAVISLSACGISNGVFKDAYNICGPLDKIIPADIYSPAAHRNQKQ